MVAMVTCILVTGRYTTVTLRLDTNSSTIRKYLGSQVLP